MSTSDNIFVVKRNGEKEPLTLDKIHKVLEWATEGLSGVSYSEIEIKAKIQFTNGLPKTRSGKIMRRILRKIANNEMDNLGDISTLLNPDCVEEIIEGRV